MGLHGKSTIEDYWHKDFYYSLRHIIQKYIGANRWQQINRYFYCTKPRSKDNEAFQNIFKRIKDLSKELRLALIRYYKPGIYLTVNETIKRFTGRAPKIVNIPTKPTPKGFKIWVLANQGYILNWIFYIKGDNKGLVDLDKFWGRGRLFKDVGSYNGFFNLRRSGDGLVSLLAKYAYYLAR